MSLAARTFATSAAGAGWVLVGYPLALHALPRRPWEQRSEATPTVTLIVPAFHERAALKTKLAALDELDYPPDRLQIIVAVDEDAELAAIAGAACPRATVLFDPMRQGKAAALTRGLAVATGEIVIFTDANNILAPGSFRAAVRHFADPSIWAVAGRRGETGSAYDRYEDWIRRRESRTGTVAAMSGEFMAVRRERAPAWPADVVNDDFWLLCQLVRQGGRVVYEPEAASTETALTADAELRRRSRMAAGRVMLIPQLRGLPAGFVWRALSHKFGRLALPYLMLMMLLSSLSAARRRPFRELAVAQVGLYGLGAAAAAGFSPPGRAGTLAGAARQLVLGNLAAIVGLARVLRGGQSTRWEPVARTPEHGAGRPG